MKKILALMLAMLMVLALCACGSTEEPAAAEAAPAAEGAAPAEGAEAPVVDENGVPEGEASGEPQQKELYPVDGFEKTFDGYKEYVTAALNADAGNPFLEQDLADVAAATEADYDPTSNPWAMQIEFGAILSYEDFLAA